VEISSNSMVSEIYKQAKGYHKTWYKTINGFEQPEERAKI